MTEASFTQGGVETSQKGHNPLKSFIARGKQLIFTYSQHCQNKSSSSRFAVFAASVSFPNIGQTKVSKYCQQAAEGFSVGRNSHLSPVFFWQSGGN
eukprot:s3344_g5.t1